MLSDDEWDKKQEEWADNDVREVALGYAMKAMFWSKVDENTMKSNIVNMKFFMDSSSVDDAVSAYENSPYKDISLEKDKTNSF